MGNHPGDPEESRDEVGTARVHAHAMDNPERPPSAQVTAKQNSPICHKHHTAKNILVAMSSAPQDRLPLLK